VGDRSGEKKVTLSALKDGVTVPANEPVKLVVSDLQQNDPGFIDFELHSEIGITTLECAFGIEGNGTQIQGRTDKKGHFRKGPVAMGEYRLTVGDAVFWIPACADGAAPHIVHVPYQSLSEIREAWKEPTPDEKAEMSS
jgi:hypothetical protein